MKKLVVLILLLASTQALAKEEDYGGGVRKVTYVDPDGNEVAFGGAPAEQPR